MDFIASFTTTYSYLLKFNALPILKVDEEDI
jgi:hypothetical protein